jgi:hypothetical protein
LNGELIEHLWWELKSLVKKLAPKREEALKAILNLGLMLLSEKHSGNYFPHCCYYASQFGKVLQLLERLFQETLPNNEKLSRLNQPRGKK